MSEAGGPDILWLIKNDPEVQKAIMELVDRHRHSTGITSDDQGVAVGIERVDWKPEEDD